MAYFKIEEEGLQMHLKNVTLFPDKYPTKDCYPFNLLNLNMTKAVIFNTPLTFFVGENGTGKSTLLKAIARKCNIHIWEPEEGRRFQYNKYEQEFYKYVGVEWANGIVPGSYFSSGIFEYFAGILDD